jgi:hypothetical protein
MKLKDTAIAKRIAAQGYYLDTMTATREEIAEFRNAMPLACSYYNPHPDRLSYFGTLIIERQDDDTNSSG